DYSELRTSRTFNYCRTTKCTISVVAELCCTNVASIRIYFATCWNSCKSVSSDQCARFIIVFDSDSISSQSATNILNGYVSALTSAISPVGSSPADIRQGNFCCAAIESEEGSGQTATKHFAHCNNVTSSSNDGRADVTVCINIT